LQAEDIRKKPVSGLKFRKKGKGIRSFGFPASRW